MKVAIFDFDGTLYPEETFSLMMKHLKNHPQHHKKYRLFMIKILPIYFAYKLKLYPEDKMKEYSMRTYISVFKNCSEKEIQKFFLELGLKMKSQLNEPVLQRFHHHKKEGFHLMLVSGAFLPLLKAVTSDLTFDCIVGTSIPFRDGCLDSETPILHIQGERKKDKIFTELVNNTIDWENSFAYGDSYSDVNVLQLVGNPVAVKPEKRLLELAKEKNWEII